MEPSDTTKELTDERGAVGIREGRFQRGMDPLFARFNASISFDCRLAEQDIRGSIAHARMLGRQGIISEDEARAIHQGLEEVLADLRSGRLAFREDLEDIHINIEQALKDKIGETAGKLHTARSRNDQVALDFRMLVREESTAIARDLLRLLTELKELARAHTDVILPGYTHFQRAQPVRLAHHLMAYFQMFTRDYRRFAESTDRADEMPLGAAALAGTTFPIDRMSVAKELGFSKISINSMDAVSDRDFALDFLFNACVTMLHLSRLAEELILWSSEELGFCELPDEYCSGSSIMPQKKNPDACELVRGKTGRVFGNLTALLTTLKALPLTYNKDVQEDKEPVFDSLDTLKGCIGIMTGILPGIVFHEDVMLRAASGPDLAATDMADRLAREGMPFREAHARVGAIMRSMRDGAGSFSDEIPTPAEMVEARNHPGGTSRNSVLEQIQEAERFLEQASGIGRPDAED